MPSFLMKFFAVTLSILLAGWLVTASTRKWKVYTNARFGYSICYPADLLTGHLEADNGDGRLNNRVENAHRQTRKREKIMGRFKSPRQAQRFLSAHDPINTVFRPRRYNLSARSWRDARADAFCLWSNYTAEMTA